MSKKNKLIRQAGIPLAAIDALELPKTAGGEILARAAGQFRSEREQYIVAQVKIILDRLSAIERIVRKSQKQAVLCRLQLSAIEANEFRISEQTLRIIFHDEEPNVSWDETATW